MRRFRLGVVCAACFFGLGVSEVAFGWMAPPDTVCAPRSDGRRCSDTRCPANSEKCVPTVVVCDAKGRCKVAECDCIDSDACHVELAGPRDALRPVCEGECPPGSECEMRREANDDGSTSVWCECVQQACEPTGNGLACQDHSCPVVGERCIPQAIHCNANGECRVVKCECQDREDCRLTLPRDGKLKKDDFRFCRGDCPDGTRCEELRTALADGGFEVICHCVPEVCEPTRDGRRCRDFDCPNDGERCTPQAVECDPDGNCKVIACDCDRPNRCHPEIANGHQDPPVVCTGQCPDGTHCVRELIPTPVGTTIVRCHCEPVPTVCEPNSTGTGCTSVNCPNRDEKCLPLEVVCIPGAPCRVTKCDCERSNRCHVQLTNATTAPTCVGNCPDGFDCERVVTPIAGGGFSVRCDCVPEPPPCEPAETGFACNPTTCPAANEKCVPIAVAVEPDGTVRVLACDCRGVGECHAVPSPLDVFPPQFDCSGTCPPGRECRERTITTDNGTVVTRCDCVPSDPECGPNSTGTDCRPITCDDASQKCRPTKVLCIPNTNVCRVVDCDCVGTDRCHVELTAAAGPICVGGCPPGQTCTREVTTTSAGVVIECRCEPVVEPCHGEIDPVTNTLICKGECPDDMECRRVEIGPAVFCRCEPIQEPCHAEVDPTTNTVVCEGVCPNGEECRRIAVGGTVTCTCDPVEPPCHREVDNGGNVTCVGVCPPGQVCTKVTITDPNGMPFEDCRCEPVQEACHREVDAVGNVICRGICPAPLNCIRVTITNPDGTTFVDCLCQPLEQPCHREIGVDGDFFCVGHCPPGQECRLIPVINPDGTTTTDCFCEDIPVPCHAELDPVTNTVVCKGVCPNGLPCRRIEQDGAVTCTCEPQEPCHPEVDDNGVVHCEGVCPNGNECRLLQPGGTACTCAPEQPCHPEVDDNGEVHCTGACPNGNECRLLQPGSTVCTCEPEPCHREVDEDGNVFCKGVCPNGLPCRLVEAGDTLICTCEPEQPCHPEVDDNGVVHCTGVCPGGAQCRLAQPGGTICTCAPEEPCHPEIDANGEVHCTGICPNGAPCRLAQPGGTVCTCEPEPTCHAEVDPATGVVSCEGTCPPGMICRMFNIDGGIACACGPIVEPCQPDPDTATGCSDTICPTGETCIPIAVSVNANGVVTVIACDCRGANECHIVPSGPAGVIPPQFDCAGGCPPGFVCQEINLSGTNGDQITRCECLPQPGCDPDPTSPTGCRLEPCPDANARCLPLRVNCFNGVCRVVECECQPFTGCHVILTPSGPVCDGNCPTPGVCTAFETLTDDGELIVECGCLEAP